MGIWRSILGLDGPALAVAAEAADAPKFTTNIDSGVLYGARTLDDWIYRSRRITRTEALRVPAVKRARDLIAGGIGQLPLRVYDADGRIATGFSPNLFTQPEPGIAPSVTWTHVVEDLLLFGHAWLRATATGWHGHVIEVRRLDPETVTIQPEWVHYSEGSALVWPDRPGLIRVDSPNLGLLDASPAVRACVELERAALNASTGTPPVDYFTVDGEVSPFEDDTAAVEFLDSWTEARRTRSTGLVPVGLKYENGSWDPEKLQLAEARTFAVLEVARLTGIDAEELSVSTTSRTYSNMQDRRRHRLESVYGPYMAAIEQLLSLDGAPVSVTPRGYRVGFDPSAFLRLDDLAAAQTDQILVTSGIATPNEIRGRRGLDPVDGGDELTVTPMPAAAPAPSKETADV